MRELMTLRRDRTISGRRLYSPDRVSFAEAGSPPKLQTFASACYGGLITRGKQVDPLPSRARNATEQNATGQNRQRAFW